MTVAILDANLGTIDRRVIMVMYSYVVCERRYQESNSPMIPLRNGSQNILSVYSNLENAYKQLLGYANNNRILEVPFMVRSLKEIKAEILENKDSTNFIVLVAQEVEKSFVPSEPSIKIFDKTDYYIQVVEPDIVIY